MSRGPPAGARAAQYTPKSRRIGGQRLAHLHGTLSKTSIPMKIFRGLHHPGIAPACAVTIGNFDGVHRGHQAMLALLASEAAHRGVESCVLTFEPHPRDYFAGALRRPELAPARIGTLRDKLEELARCGVQQAVVLPFNERLARQPPGLHRRRAGARPGRTLRAGGR